MGHEVNHAANRLRQLVTSQSQSGSDSINQSETGERAEGELQLIDEILVKQGTSQLGSAQQQQPLMPLAVELIKQALPTLQGELARKPRRRRRQQWR